MPTDDEERHEIELLNQEMLDKFSLMFDEIEEEIDEMERNDRRKNGITLQRLCRFLILFITIFYLPCFCLIV